MGDTSLLIRMVVLDEAQDIKSALADSINSGAAGRKQALFTEGDLTELLEPLSA